MNNRRELLKSNKMYLSDGGLETTLIFHQGIELPHFASFVLYNDPRGEAILEEYYNKYIQIALDYQLGFVLESATWRASSDWGYKLGYSSPELEKVNQKSVAHLLNMKKKFQSEKSPFLVSGCLGPRGDGYNPSYQMDVKGAAKYHTPQIRAMHEAGADLISAFTINYSDEAIGISLAAKRAGIPVVISFTSETDGKLPNGETFKDAIEKVDAFTDAYPAYYMINCAHPSHFEYVFYESGGEWINRVKGIRANASCKSHAELDECEHIDVGDKVELAEKYHSLREYLPNLQVFGGCCGTDASHLKSICQRTFSINVV